MWLSQQQITLALAHLLFGKYFSRVARVSPFECCASYLSLFLCLVEFLPSFFKVCLVISCASCVWRPPSTNFAVSCFAKVVVCARLISGPRFVTLLAFVYSILLVVKGRSGRSEMIYFFN